MQCDLLPSEFKIILLNPRVHLTEHAVWEYLLELLSGTYHVLGVVDVWEEAVDACFEVGLSLGERPEELVVEEHQVHDTVVSDQGFL